MQKKPRQIEFQTKLEAQTPAVNAIKRLTDSEGSVCIQDAAEYVADGTA